jgi:hypothetical protein
MADRFSYEGAWVLGTMTGRGVARYAAGDIYEGMFLDGKRQGAGEMRYADGTIVSGNWANGQLVEPAAEGN